MTNTTLLEKPYFFHLILAKVLIDTTFYVSFKNNETLPKYFYHLLKLINLESLGGGIGVPGLNRNLVHEIKIPLVPRNIQEKIIANIEVLEGNQKKEKEKIKLLKGSIDNKVNTLIAKSGTTSVSKIAKVKGGKRVPKGFRLLSTKTDFPYIRVTDFNNGTVSLESLKYIDEKTFSKISRYTINSDEIYISIAGTIGLVGTIPSELNGKSLTENAAKIVITDKTQYDYKFLYYVMASNYVQSQIQEKTKKLGVPKLALKRIESILIPKVDLIEQQKIIKEFEKIESEITKIESFLENIESEKGQILKKYLE